MYLDDSKTIEKIIKHLCHFPTLWMDTEIADWQTANPQLSLVQVLREDTSENQVYILDIFEKPQLINLLIEEVMRDEKIEKIFHNASFDLKYLGKKTAKNITCTYQLARKISKQRLGTSNLKLKTLAVELCQFPEEEIDRQQQSSDWGKRPLNNRQLYYAEMDVVYLFHVHQYLLKFHQPSQENLKMNQSNSPTFTVTDVLVAFECPRLFYLSKNFGGKTLFIPADQAKGIGKLFHELAFKFIELAKKDSRFKEIFHPNPKDLNQEEVTLQMQRIFYEEIFFPGLEKVAEKKPQNVPVLQKIWEGLRGLIAHWSELLIKNRYYCNYNSVISQTFISQEITVSCDYSLPDQKSQKIVGRFDTLICDLQKNRLCMVEYKTYHPLDPAAQLAQVSLYSYILNLDKQKPVDSAVYCVLPEFKVYHYTWEELKDTVHELTPLKLQQMRQWLSWKPSQPDPPPPTQQIEKLCPICPQQETCQNYFSEESIVQTKKKEQETDQLEKQTQKQEADQLGKQLEEILQAYGVEVDYQGAIAGVSFIRIKLRPRLGVKVVSIINRATDIQVQMGLSHPPLISPQAGYLTVDLPRSQREIARFEDYIQGKCQELAIKIAIGIDLDGNLIEAELSDPNTCHFLIGGTTGSGKSEFLKSLVMSLIKRYPDQLVKLALIDPKRVTFPEFEASNWLMCPIIKDRDRAIKFMEELVAKMEERYQQFEQARCSDLRTYNQQLIQNEQKPIPHLVCLFDEYADFMVEKEIREALELNIKRLGAMARAAGIHLIISTQRPEAKVVTPIIRSNLPGRVALKTSSEADSKIILGGNQTEAAYLLGKGDLLFLRSGELSRLQSLLIQK